MVDGTMRIRCEGQGVPFTSVSSGRTLREAIRSASRDGGLWLVDPVNGATARWGLGPLCKVRVTHLADDATAIGFSWHHAIGDMQTSMHFMNAWAAAAADKPLAEPLIVEDRAAYLDEHLPCRWRSAARGALPRARRICTQRAVPGKGCAKAADSEYLLRRRRNRPHARRIRKPDALVCERRCVRTCFRSAHEGGSRGGSSHPRDRRECAESLWPQSDAHRQHHHDGEPRPAARRARSFDCRTHPPHRGPFCRRTLRHADQPAVPGRCRCLAGRSLCIHCLQSGPVEPRCFELGWLRRLPHPIRRHLPVLLHAVVEVTRCGARCPGGRGGRPWDCLPNIFAAKGIRGHV